eukprot:Gb_05316 [translate_table: standard]
MESEDDKISPENKKRRLKTPSQVEGLENFYAEHKYPSEAMKAQLSAELGLSEKQVQGWFCHRRLKDKRLMREETTNSGKHESHNGLIQDPGNGLKQDSSGSGKKVEHQHRLTSKEVENQRFPSFTDYPAAVLASELRDQDLLTGNHDIMEDTFAGSSSASQERSSLQSGNPYEMEAMRHSLPNGIRYEMETKRRHNRDFHMDAYSQENGEHEAVIAVKQQLGDEFREDGPPLSVEFHPLPPGAFDAPIESHYQGSTVIQDYQRVPKKGKEPEAAKMFGLEGLHTACTSGVRSGYSAIPVGVKFERASPKFERASHSKHESVCGKSTWRPANNHLHMGDNYQVPDLNSSMQLDEDSADEAPSSGFVTKSYPAWHKQGAAGRPGGDVHLPLFYGSKNGNGIAPGKNGNMIKELSISRPYNSADLYYDAEASAVNLNVKAALPVAQHSDLLSSQEDKAQPKKMNKRERLREERRIQREQERVLRLKQKLIQKEERRIERQKQTEESRRQREVSKCQAAAEKVSSSKNQTKGFTGEIPTSFSEDEVAAVCSSMD